MSRREIESRLQALEQQHGTDGPMRVRRIVLAPGGEQMPVLGWRCGDIETRIAPGEPEEACWQRHVDALEHAHGDAVTQSVQLVE
jgi:hypothetical protein